MSIFIPFQFLEVTVTPYIARADGYTFHRPNEKLFTTIYMKLPVIL